MNWHAILAVAGALIVIVLAHHWGYRAGDRYGYARGHESGHRKGVGDRKAATLAAAKAGYRKGREDAEREYREAAKARLRKQMAARANLSHMVTDASLHALIEEYQRGSK